MNKDELEGRTESTKGKIKETAGDATGNERMKNEGAADQAAGKTQETFGKARKKVGDAAKDLGDKLGG